MCECESFLLLARFFLLRAWVKFSYGSGIESQINGIESSTLNNAARAVLACTLSRRRQPRWTKVHPKRLRQELPNRRWRGVNATVIAQPGIGTTYHGALVVAAFTNAAGPGMVNQSAAPSGAPDIYIPGVSAGNWVFAIGNDWDNAIAHASVGSVLGTSASGYISGGHLLGAGDYRSICGYCFSRHSRQCAHRRPALSRLWQHGNE